MSIVIDRLNTEIAPPVLDEFSTLPIMGKDLLLRRIEEQSELKFGVFACMPRINASSKGPSDLVYEYGPAVNRGTIDIKASALGEWKKQFENAFDIDVNLACLVADTEARVKSDGYLYPREKDGIASVTMDVISRIGKRFPGEVKARSDVFPVSDPIYRGNFLRVFREVYAEICEDDVRYTSRFNALIELGLDEDFARERARRDIALQDAEYAMEGLWIARDSGWDALIIVDNYPLSSAGRTTRLLNPNELPIIFPGNYEIIE